MKLEMECSVLYSRLRACTNLSRLKWYSRFEEDLTIINQLCFIWCFIILKENKTVVKLKKYWWGYFTVLLLTCKTNLKLRNSCVQLQIIKVLSQEYRGGILYQEVVHIFDISILKFKFSCK